MQIKNTSGSDLEVVGVGLVAAGDTFTASGDLADSLLTQPHNFTAAGEEPADIHAMTVAQLQSYAGDHGIDLAGAKRRDEILSIIQAAPATPEETA